MHVEKKVKVILSYLLHVARFGPMIPRFVGATREAMVHVTEVRTSDRGGLK
jgi:hypothetical protein